MLGFRAATTAHRADSNPSCNGAWPQLRLGGGQPQPWLSDRQVLFLNSSCNLAYRSCKTGGVTASAAVGSIGGTATATAAAGGGKAAGAGIMGAIAALRSVDLEKLARPLWAAATLFHVA